MDYHFRSDPPIYNDSNTPRKLATDERTPQEKKWEADWIKVFGDAKVGKGPRLYLFSIQYEPQAIFEKCVDASGGQSKIVDWLRNGGNPPPVTDSDPVEIKKSSVSTPASTNR